MEWITCDSSNISKFAYDATTDALYIEFHHGGVYQYFDVPSSVYDRFRSASSKGQFLASEIKGSYRYSRV